MILLPPSWSLGKARRAVTLTIVTLEVGACAWWGWVALVKPAMERLCLDRPGSTRQLILSPDARPLAIAPPFYTPPDGDAAESATFVTPGSADAIWRYYERSLLTDGWYNLGDPFASAADPARKSAQFVWQCGSDGPNPLATLDLHTEVLSTGVTKVTLNFSHRP